MEARAIHLHELLEGEKQYIVPVFQRHYAWDREQWKQLWNDILSLIEKEKLEEGKYLAEHFLGAIVCMPGKQVPYAVPQYVLIDGHQRLATIAILLCALRDLSRERGSKDLADEIQDKYLIDKYKKGLERFKIISRLEDRDLLFALIDCKLPKDWKCRLERVIRAYSYFKEKISEQCHDEKELRRLFRIITKQLAVVIITLDPSKDNPYMIFETLNWRGLPLEEADLIRNYIFMHVPLNKQKEFDEKIWVPFENMFKKRGDFATINITDFYRDYLMSKGRYVKKREVYLQFRRSVDLEKDRDPWEVVKELKYYGKFYVLIHRPSNAVNADLRDELRRFQDLNASTAYPLILYLFDKYEKRELPLKDLLKSLRMIESFVIRRLVCGETSRPYNYWFPQTVRRIEERLKIGVSILNALTEFFNEKGWPDDKRFKEALLTFPIYSSAPKMCRMILEELEKSYEHKELVDLSASNIQIEHIMPMTLSDAWKEMLGSEWERIYNTYLHTIGNLTLSGYNQELYNKLYPEKRKRLINSNLSLNKYFENVKVWGEEEIIKRGRKLAERIVQIWPHTSRRKN